MRQASDFEEFYQGSYRRVVAVAAAVLGDRQEAEDVAQEAFARALVRWPRLGGYDQPEAWVRRVALNLAVDSGRRVRRGLRAQLRLLARSRDVGGDPADQAGSTPLSLALARVPLRQREILVLHYLLDLPVRQIAQERGLPQGTVKARLIAGRRRLEQELADIDQEACHA